MIDDKDTELELAHRKEFGTREDASEKEHWDYTLGGFRKGAAWSIEKLKERSGGSFEEFYSAHFCETHDGATIPSAFHGARIEFDHIKIVWQVAAIASEARHSEEIKAKNARIAELDDKLQKIIQEDFLNENAYEWTQYCQSMRYEYDKEIEALETRIEKLRVVLDKVSSGSSHSSEWLAAYYLKALANDDLAGGK